MSGLKSALLACAVLATGALTATQASARVFIYQVTVKTSFGTKFSDCFTFTPNGVLTIAGLGTLAYTAAPNDPKFYYTAVTSPSESAMLGNSFAFAGFHKGTASSGSIHAVGTNDVHNSYDVHGMAAASCTAAAPGSYVAK